MSRPFGKDKSVTKKKPRNTFDHSFVNNLTLDFGKLTPFCVKEVLSGDSAEIDLGIALRAMPMVFPVQTNMRVDMHMFYVRTRNLWKDFPDFYGDHKTGLVSPYLTNLTKENAGVGQLFDYLGLPNTLAGGYGSFTSKVFSTQSYDDDPYFITAALQGSNASQRVNLFSLAFEEERSFFTIQRAFDSTTVDPSTVPADSIMLIPLRVSVPVGEYPDIRDLLISRGSITFDLNFPNIQIPTDIPVICSISNGDFTTNTATFKSYSRVRSDGHTFSVSFPIAQDVFQNMTHAEFTSLNFCIMVPSQTSPAYSDSSAYFPNLPIYSTGYGFSATAYIGDKNTVVDIYDRPSNLINPFLPSSPESIPTIPVSALPARAYESIYNAFYRDERNNPYILNGEKEYNKYLPTTDGGADDNFYTLHYRNWEQDFLTTAVPSPQQGNAPLVGISSSGQARFVDEESGKEYAVQLTTADDGDTVTGVQYGEALPNSVLRSIVDVVSSGISINDFRNVNAFQRWLETNIRKGYKFRDIIRGHFGVTPSYAELDMPEFLGGHSEIINVSQVTQTSESTELSPLGSYAGQGYAFGRGKHKIRRYFDEPGYLIGIVSISPVPCYSQLLPKHFLKRDVLDYFWPEFGHIGLQPITYKEVCPIQAYAHGDSVNDVFGYQRAWYDYLQSVDEVHGEFRTTLRDFLLNRVFGSRPTLSPDFLVIDPKQTNNIWAVNETSDKFIGLINVGLSMKRPIPKYGIPKLEA